MVVPNRFPGQSRTEETRTDKIRDWNEPTIRLSPAVKEILVKGIRGEGVHHSTHLQEDECLHGMFPSAPVSSFPWFRSLAFFLRLVKMTAFKDSQKKKNRSLDGLFHLGRWVL